MRVKNIYRGGRWAVERLQDGGQPHPRGRGEGEEGLPRRWWVSFRILWGLEAVGGSSTWPGGYREMFRAVYQHSRHTTSRTVNGQDCGGKRCAATTCPTIHPLPCSFLYLCPLTIVSLLSSVLSSFTLNLVKLARRITDLPPERRNRGEEEDEEEAKENQREDREG